MLLLAAGGIVAVRNVVWFALTTLIMLPGGSTGGTRARASARRPGRG